MDSNICIFQSGRGRLMCETKLHMQEGWAKSAGGGAYARGGGDNCGILRYLFLFFLSVMPSYMVCSFNSQWSSVIKHKMEVCVCAQIHSHAQADKEASQVAMKLLGLGRKLSFVVGPSNFIVYLCHCTEVLSSVADSLGYGRSSSLHIHDRFSAALALHTGLATSAIIIAKLLASMHSHWPSTWVPELTGSWMWWHALLTSVVWVHRGNTSKLYYNKMAYQTHPVINVPYTSTIT